MRMDETSIALEEVKPEVPKGRPSIFRRSQVEATQPLNDSIHEAYALKLQHEKDEWIRLFNEAKGRNAALKKELKSVQSVAIDYSLLSPEEMQFVEAQPDYDGFARQVYDLQKQLQAGVAQHKCLAAMFHGQLGQAQAKVDHLKQVVMDSTQDC